MLDNLARHWWVLTVRGVIAVLFGLFAIFWPGLTLLLLAIFFGAYVLVDGIFAGIAGFRAEAGNRAPFVVAAIAGIGAGLIVLVWPEITIIVMALLFAAWAVITGIFEIVAAVKLRREISGEWLFILAGVLSVVFGVLVAILPYLGAVVIAFIIGVYAVVFGAALIALSLRVRTEGQERGAIT
ncbi:HdeD family acid-resistance protein [Nocardiopsis rhodophaea]|uniref:HdeD family acid-resistance protein n=1 Tax=Nocardiopsis rhodophaea TaxID=280238 RepID=UPI0031D955C3